MLEILDVPRRRLSQHGDLGGEVGDVAQPVQVDLVQALVQFLGLAVQGVPGITRIMSWALWWLLPGLNLSGPVDRLVVQW